MQFNSIGKNWLAWLLARLLSLFCHYFKIKIKIGIRYSFSSKN